MKLLLFSDLHADLDGARNLVRLARTADLVLSAGDLGNVRRQLQPTVDVLKAIDRPTVLVAGNNESTEELTHACRGWPTAHVLHGTMVELLGVQVFGIGGGIPVTPFGSWSYDFTEKEAESLLRPCPPGGILVSHSPPRGFVDVASSGKSLGSTALRGAIERLRPRLVVCGHIHACAGRSATLGRTTIINAGPEGILWELPATLTTP